MVQQSPSPQDERRARTTLLTIGALYFIPLSIGTRVEGLGPQFLLMLGLAGVTVSKVVHLREAVDETNRYPAQLVVVDLGLIVALMIMFHVLAHPFCLSSAFWGETMLDGVGRHDTSHSAFLRGAVTFWSLAIALFVFLIPIWTWVSWRYQGLRRHSLWRYIVGWAIGATLSGGMLWTALFDSATHLTQRYAVAGPVSLVSGLFLCLEVFAGSRFERRDPPDTSQ